MSDLETIYFADWVTWLLLQLWRHSMPTAPAKASQAVWTSRSILSSEVPNKYLHCQVRINLS
jgi:hypothetical protein